jgi:hypothetical protein
MYLDGKVDKGGYSNSPWGAGIFLDFHGKSLSIHYNGEDGGIEYDGL